MKKHIKIDCRLQLDRSFSILDGQDYRSVIILTPLPSEVINIYHLSTVQRLAVKTLILAFMWMPCYANHLPQTHMKIKHTLHGTYTPGWQWVFQQDSAGCGFAKTCWGSARGMLQESKVLTWPWNSADRTMIEHPLAELEKSWSMQLWSGCAWAIGALLGPRGRLKTLSSGIHVNGSRDSQQNFVTRWSVLFTSSVRGVNVMAD